MSTIRDIKVYRGMQEGSGQVRILNRFEGLVELATLGLAVLAGHH